jgi:hypothetical protein
MVFEWFTSNQRMGNPNAVGGCLALYAATALSALLYLQACAGGGSDSASGDSSSTPDSGSAPEEDADSTSPPKDSGGQGVNVGGSSRDAGGAVAQPDDRDAGHASDGDNPGDSGAAGEATLPKVPTLIGDVTFSTPSQAFRGQLDVTMTTAIKSAQIRYTTDGNMPTAQSPLFDGAPLKLTETTRLRAHAFVDGSRKGRVTTALYIARDFEFTSDLPIVIVDGYGGGKPVDKEVFLPAAVMVFEPVDGEASLAALPTIATRAGYHVRGQSSRRWPKTPYRLEFRDNAGEDADYPVLGMPAQSDWALIPPYYDRTLIRNPFAFELGRDMGLEAPRSAYVEVYLSYEGRVLKQSDYQGIYWFTETIKNAKERTNLKQLTGTETELPEISGGYIFKFDQAVAEEPILTCVGSQPLAGGFGFLGGGGGGIGGGTCWVDLEVVDPDPLIPEQQAWLTQYIQAFHDSLHTTPIGNYAEYIDVPSFIDYLIISELSRDVDAYVRSAYFYKDRGDKIHAGPLWDYNFSLGLGGQSSIDPNGPFQYEGRRNVNNWYPRLIKDPAFMDAVRARWRELRQGLLSDNAMRARMDALTAPLAGAIEREYARWPVAEIYANAGIVRGSTARDWAAQLNVMRDFVIARAAKIDSVY